MRVELRILRRAPGKGPYWQAFSLETEGRERLSDRLGGRNGVWRCRNAHNCTEACPRGIDVNRLITEVKRRILEEAF